MNQLNHSEITNSQHDKEIVIIGDQIDDKKNIGMMFRLADAFGALAVLSNKNFQVKTDSKINRISRSTSSKIPFHHSENLKTNLEEMKSKGYRIVCLEKCDKSRSIVDHDSKKNSKVALVVGNENLGISPGLLEIADDVLHIPMFGINTSMNVIHALAIGLYEMTK
jgi:23S rRNA (guanosine2251-2'-O)-methyltransferase